MTRPLDILRLLLGAVMVVTALNHFVPLWPEPAWDDPMAARLMTAFDRSGLLEVAKTIHLIAGALLLANRAVPFALAALMPVNVCGTFISLMLEGHPLVAVLALLTLALNGLLMLAYLPSYRSVLAADQLAFGEGPEDGRNYNSLFVNPLSRAPASAYLGAAAALAGALAFYWQVVPFANGPTGLVTLLFPTLVLAIGGLSALTRRGRKAGER